jgi:hypothetical protein
MKAVVPGGFAAVDNRPRWMPSAYVEEQMELRQ